MKNGKISGYVLFIKIKKNVSINKARNALVLSYSWLKFHSGWTFYKRGKCGYMKILVTYCGGRMVVIIYLVIVY